MDNLLKIILFLGKKYPQQFTMHELSKALHIPYATFYRTIEEKNNMLHIQTIGKAKAVKLNVSHPTLKSYLAIASQEEKEEFLKKHIILNKISTELNTTDIVTLFGSYAKGTYTQKSDLDLLIINSNGKKSIPFSKYEFLFNIKINPLYITKKEFTMMIKENEENVGKQALKEHIILNNPEAFWELIVNELR